MTAFVDIFLDDVYRLHGMRNADIKTIVDVGANVGVFAVCARLYFPASCIHAYEPNEGLLGYLSRHAESAGFQVFSEAVGSSNSMVALRKGHESVLTTVQEDPTGTTVQVNLRTVASRIGGRVDLIKLDCEGAEWNLLAEKNAWRPFRRITMEYHLSDGRRHADVIAALRDVSFEVVSHVFDPLMPQGLVFAVNRSEI